MAGSNVYFSGRIKSEQFTASGTFTVPDGVSSVVVEMYGGGGSGANVFGGLSDVGFGGEAGDYTVKPVVVSSGANITVTIGAGGAGQNSNGLDGNDGGDTSFGTVFARGGRGGQASNTSSPFDIAKGHGTGRDSVYSIGGSTTVAGETYHGGDGAFGSGTTGVAGTSSNAGIGAGSGAGGTASGSGGSGICIVYYQVD